MTGRELIRLQATLHGLIGAEAERRRRRAARAGRARPRPPTAASAPTRAACGGGSTSPRRSSTSPQVLFLDEPTTGLDPVSRKAIWEEVAALNDEGTTVFLTTQYLEEADQLADRVGIIDGGRIVAEGTPASLKAEVGKPHLEIGLARRRRPSAAERGLRARSASSLPEQRRQASWSSSSGGASDVAKVVRALDEAGIVVESLELVEPTLDDVFVAKTGEHLEGDDEQRRARAAAER